MSFFLRKKRTYSRNNSYQKFSIFLPKFLGSVFSHEFFLRVFLKILNLYTVIFKIFTCDYINLFKIKRNLVYS